MAKKIHFRKNKRKPHPWQKAFDAIDEALFLRTLARAMAITSDALFGRYDLGPLLSDRAKSELFEAGFPGFKVQIPYPKPIRPAFPRGGPEPEYVIMGGRQMGRSALFDQLYGPGGEPESEISYQERVSRHRLDRTTEFNPGKQVIDDSPLANETILEARLRQIRQAQANSLPANQASQANGSIQAADAASQVEPGTVD